MMEVHDAMTSLAFHGKTMPEGMTPQILAGVNKEATRRMGALVAPHVKGEHGEDILRLGMGQLFQKVCAPPTVTADGRLYSTRGRLR